MFEIITERVQLSGRQANQQNTPDRVHLSEVNFAEAAGMSTPAVRAKAQKAWNRQQSRCWIHHLNIHASAHAATFVIFKILK
jgi:hypothetical protein